MPTSKMKVKSGKKYNIAYRVNGAVGELSRDVLEKLALSALRSSARSFCIRKLNEAEPAIVRNQNMRTAMISSGLASEITVDAFFAAQNMVLEIPSKFEIGLDELIPSEESGRGRRSADLFSFEGDEGDDDDDDDEVGETPTE